MKSRRKHRLALNQTVACPISCKMKSAALAVLWIALTTHGVASAAERVWREIPGGRMAPLQVPGSGAPGEGTGPTSQKVGFTLLGPEGTGGTFTNSVDEAAAAANRLL